MRPWGRKGRTGGQRRIRESGGTPDSEQSHPPSPGEQDHCHRQRHHGHDQQHLLHGRLPQLEVKDEQKAHQSHHDVQRHQEREMGGEQRREHEQKRQRDSHGRNGQPLIILPRPLFFRLALRLHHIEIPQTYQPGQAVQGQNDHAYDMIHAQLIADDDRQGPETDDVAERIYLYPEAFLILRPVLLGPGHLSIEHVAEPRKGQKENRPPQLHGRGAENPCHCRNETDIGKHHCIIIKSYHRNPSSFCHTSSPAMC